jgi:hypothetical protein
MAKRKSEKWRSVTDPKTRPPESSFTEQNPFKIKTTVIDSHGSNVVVEAKRMGDTLFTALGAIHPDEFADLVIGWKPYKVKAKKGADGE